MAVGAALGLQGCFSAAFLEDTCERLPGGCGGGSSSSSGDGTSGSSTSGGELPTTSGSGSGESSSGTTGGSPGILFPGPAFRIEIGRAHV